MKLHDLCCDMLLPNKELDCFVMIFGACVAAATSRNRLKQTTPKIMFWSGSRD